MIEAKGLCKSFGDIVALDHIDALIKDGSVFGLIGTNGAGKSTFMRIMAGILKSDEGSVTIDEEDVFENPHCKSQFFYISDEQHFLSNSTAADMESFYSKIYENFNRARFDKLLAAFDLPKSRKISTFSKGMKKQLSIILALSSMTRYIFCDETFDGLDPVMRQGIKSLFAAEVEERALTPIIASHNLRELEDICDHVGLLHRGGILFSKDLDDMKLSIHKIQCVLPEDSAPTALDILDIALKDERGRLLTLTVRGMKDDIEDKIKTLNPIFFEIIPLSLEEIFISETEVKGYDIKKLLF